MPDGSGNRMGGCQTESNASGRPRNDYSMDVLFAFPAALENPNGPFCGRSLTPI